jgi:hypothetical protein
MKIEQVRNWPERHFRSEKHHKQNCRLNQELKNQTFEKTHANQHPQAERQKAGYITTYPQEQFGTSFELSEFQPGTIKQTSNSRVQKPQIYIVNHDHSSVITWSDTHIIMHGSKRSNFRKALSSSRFSFLFSRKHCKVIYPDCKRYSQAQRLSRKDSRRIEHHLHQSQRCVAKAYP